MFKDLEKYYFYSYTDTTDEVQTVNIVSPGKKKSDFDIELVDNILTVSIGNYFEKFKLTDKVDQKKISAEYESGILTVSLPRKESVKPKKIEVI